MKFIDSWFWCRYTLNPYNGCEFACTYCDSRSHKYHLYPEFDQEIYIKTNVGMMLDNRLRRARTILPDVVAIGGTCDSYQPAEREYKNTQTCLEVLLKHHYPVSLSTKSDLVLRDLELLSNISDDTWCTVGITITTVDEKLASFLEPNAPSPKTRLETLRQITTNAPNIQVGSQLLGEHSQPRLPSAILSSGREHNENRAGDCRVDSLCHSTIHAPSAPSCARSLV